MGGRSSGESVLELSQFERHLQSFDVAWSNRTPPGVAEFLGAIELTASDPLREKLLWELIAIDMEHRWRCRKPLATGDELGCRPSLRDYARHVAEVGPVEQLPAWLFVEEYRVRRLWGDSPNTDQFVSEYPDQMVELIKLLPLAERELVADGAVIRPKDHFQLAPPSDPRAPLRHTDYVLEKLLGTGATGKVYRATQLSLQRPVAIKALLKARQQDLVAVEQFVLEARIVGQLNHPNIVNVHGLGRFPAGGYFQVMQLIEGQDLAAHLQSETLNVIQAIRISCDVAGAIEHAHGRGIVHCDLKPANVLLGATGQAFVTDFGFAQLLTGAEQATCQGGTIGYLAPERIDADDHPITTAVDIYGLGALLYTLLTNRPPRLVTSHAGLVQSRAIVPVGDVLPGIPPALAAICMKCLRTHPADRYQQASDVAAALRLLMM